MVNKGLIKKLNKSKLIYKSEQIFRAKDLKELLGISNEEVTRLKVVDSVKKISCHFHYFYCFTFDDSGTSNEWPYNHLSVITLSFNDLITKNVFELRCHIKTPSCPLRASKQPDLVRKPCFVGGHIHSASCLENQVGIGNWGNSHWKIQ